MKRLIATLALLVPCSVFAAKPFGYVEVGLGIPSFHGDDLDDLESIER